MQDFTIFDMVIIGITLVLGLKGLFRGLIKEVFGIIGIIGAIFVASRVSKDIGELIAPFLALENQTTIKLIGFIVALIGFWLIAYLLGVLISKIFSASGLGIFDRVFGFIFGAAKIFLIFSVIAYALYQVEAFKKTIDEKTANSFVMPYLIDIGSYIIKLDTSSLTKQIENTVDNVVEKTKETANDLKQKEQTVQESVENTTEQIKQGVENTINETKEAIQENVIQKAQEQLDTVKENLDNSNTPVEEKN